MADQLGYFAVSNLAVEAIKQANWPVTRDNLLNGEIDAAHAGIAGGRGSAANLTRSGRSR